jgi:hypothetical protein
MVKHLYRADGSFQPNTNHAYSGRVNDDQPGLYFYCKLLSILFFRWGEAKRPTLWAGTYATADRLRKYAVGTFSLGVLAYGILGVRIHAAPDAASAHVGPPDWMPLVFGAVGACVNTKILHSWLNICLLVFCAFLIVSSSYAHMAVFACYLLKTTVGDMLAGKVDAMEWRVGAAFVLILSFAAYHTKAIADAIMSVDGGQDNSGNLAAFLVALTMHQFTVEYADARFDTWIFFRHRYLYELFYIWLAVFGLWPLPLPLMQLSSFEMGVVRCDVVACWAYRLCNALQCLLAKYLIINYYSDAGGS